MRESAEIRVMQLERKGMPDAYILGAIASLKRDWRMVERARAELSGRILRDFEDGLLVQDSKHAA